MIATKKNEKKSPGSDVDSDSKHSEGSDESSVKKLDKKPKLKKTTQAKCKSSLTLFSVLILFAILFFTNMIFPVFFCEICFPFIDYDSN
jgi:hypothetical protein